MIRVVSKQVLRGTLFALLLAAPLAHLRAEDEQNVETRQDRSYMRAAWEPIKNTADAIAKGSTAVGQRMREEVLRMREFFGVVLPGAANKYRFSLDFEPKAGDLIRREYIRYPMLLHYGLAERWETYGGVTPVSPNPFDTGEDHRWSMGQGKLGIRYDFPPNTWKLQRMTMGFEVLQPLGRPPMSLIDQYTHLRPYTTIACPLVHVPDTTLLVSLTYDRAVGSSKDRDDPPDFIRRHVTEIAPGLLYKPGELGAFLQYGLRFLDEPAGSRLGHYGKIGMIWDPPMSRTKRWHLPGKWQFELGYKVSDEEGYVPDHGIHARVKWRTEFFKRKWRELMTK